jgi:hypothetical protein
MIIILKSKKKENNPKIYCHFCWFSEWISQDRGAGAPPAAEVTVKGRKN